MRCEGCVFGDDMVIRPMPIGEIDDFISIIKEEYAGMMEKVGSDIVDLVQRIRKGSLNVREGRHGRSVFDSIFGTGSCEEGGDPEDYAVRCGVEISLEAFKPRSSPSDTAYVPMIVFHACSINNEMFDMLNREIETPPSGVRPSNIPGKVAVAYSVGGY